MSIRNVIIVARREFSSSFRRFYAYVTVALTALVGAIFLILGNLAYSSDSILSVLSNMSLFIALIIPVTAVNSFASSKKDTDALYDMMPFSVSDVVVGKYISALWQTLIPTVFMVVIFPLAASMYSKSFDMAVTYSSGAAYLFFCAALLAVCFFIALRAKTRPRAYIYCYATVVVWYLVGIAVAAISLKPVASLIAFLVLALALAVALYLYLKSIALGVGFLVVSCGVTVALYLIDPRIFVRSFEEVVGKVAIFTCFDRFICGMFDLRTLAFFIVVTVTFVLLAIRRYCVRYAPAAKKDGLRIRGITSRAVLPIVLALALALSLGVSAMPSGFTAFDATQSGKNSVSPTAKAYLSGLDKDVTIYLIEPTGLAPNYEMYLEELVSCSDRLTLERVYHANTPEFYSDRDISTENISVNSLVIECADRSQYLSYLSLFTYTNETLGFTEISTTEYNYYYQMFANNSAYASYMDAIEYDTKMQFCGDAMICSYIEYVTADVVPAQYALTGHGEHDVTAEGSPYLGISQLTLEGDVPADVSSILINTPTADISEAQKQALIAYLERGGQITFVTDEKVFDMPNILSVLASYGMSAQRSFLKMDAEDKDGNAAKTTELMPVIETNNDILYALDGASLSVTVKNANAIIRDGSLRTDLLHFPLLTVSEDKVVNGEEQTVTHILACAAETENGGRVVWFTGGSSFNDAENDACAVVVYSLYWTSIQFATEVPDMPSVVYQSSMSKVSDGSAKAIGALLVIAPLAFVGFGAVMVYRRKKSR